MVAEEIEASLDPADEGLVTRAEVRSWLSTAYLIAPIGRPVCDPKADIRGNEHEGPKRVDLGPSRPDDPLSLPERRGSARMDSVSTSMVMTRWSSSSREVEVHSAESFILSI